jgi:cytochrome P450
VYGIGKHVCPGRLLATLELRILMQELLAATPSIALDPQYQPEREVSPVGGWAKVPVVLA